MKQLVKLMQAQFDRMSVTGKLFRVDVSGDLLYRTYLEGFLPEDNGIFRDPGSTIHNLNNPIIPG